MSRTVRLETRGKVHDLQKIFNSLNSRYFHGKIKARIIWGLRRKPGCKPRHRNSIKMGSYCFVDKLIRVHPSLDRKFVPRYFVKWIVFHEMLHQKQPIPTVKGRRQFHTPAFNAEEAAFPGFKRGKKWEEENLNHLLVY